MCIEELRDPRVRQAGLTRHATARGTYILFLSPRHAETGEPVSLVTATLASRRDTRLLQLGIVALSYVIGLFVYLGIWKYTTAEGLLQFFATGTTVTASFLVTDAIALLTLRPEVQEYVRIRWLRFFLELFVGLFFGVLVSGIWLFTFAATFPSVSGAVDVGVVIVLSSWFLGMLTLILEIASLVPRD